MCFILLIVCVIGIANKGPVGLVCFYEKDVQDRVVELGLTTKTLADGTTIRLYNMERTICDIIRDRNKIDSQIFNTALKEYMKRKDKNLNLLYEYAKVFKISKILKMYLEVLS